MALKEDIINLVEPVLNEENFELVELKLSQYKRNNRLQFYVDSDNGVTIDDCVRLTKLIEPHLEKSNLFSYRYIIEISSPGLDRPLKTAADFKRRIGEEIRVFFNNDELPPLEGKLTYADDERIEILKDDNKETVELKTVRLGKIII
jgi:ribosome maturation factor RimP